MKLKDIDGKILNVQAVLFTASDAESVPLKEHERRYLRRQRRIVMTKISTLKFIINETMTFWDVSYMESIVQATRSIKYIQ